MIGAGSARPFVQWAGGKGQLLEQLLARVPERIGTYHEPFVGGGALFFQLRALGRVRQACLSDANPDLIDAYRTLRDAPDAVISELERLQQKTGEADYYAVRALDASALTAAQRSARLIYLNKAGFNGLFRVNAKGGFNVPYGHDEKVNVLDRENLLAVGRALRGVNIEIASFDAVLKRARRGDFVYFDPPYHPVSKTARFTAYTKCGFGEEAQRQLAQVVAELTRQGVDVLLSNSDTEFTRALYQGRGWEIETIERRRGIARRSVAELLVRAPAIDAAMVAA